VPFDVFLYPSGKTIAFVIGMLARIDVRNDWTQALCLTPTRELANQVPLASCTCYAWDGGHEYCLALIANFKLFGWWVGNVRVCRSCPMQ
jgi:hypothetical protein